MMQRLSASVIRQNRSAAVSSLVTRAAGFHFFSTSTNAGNHPAIQYWDIPTNSDDLILRQIPTFSDNYVYFLHSKTSGETVCVDPGESEPVLKALPEWGWQLTHILLTHHHNDHIGGVQEIVTRIPRTQIVGSKQGASRLPPLNVAVSDGDQWISESGALGFKVLEIPGHTVDHIAFASTHSNTLFCGDTMFSMGCGRLFEGTPQQMLASLSHLSAYLPDDTLVCCAHEYTTSNGIFAKAVDPDNQALDNRIQQVKQLRQKNLPTVPSTLEMEKATNPFLINSVQMLDYIPDKYIPCSATTYTADTVQEPELCVFTALRSYKDNF